MAQNGSISTLQNFEVHQRQHWVQIFQIISPSILELHVVPEDFKDLDPRFCPRQDNAKQSGSEILIFICF